MAKVSIRDLRNHGGEVVERASGGEAITITRSGRPVAELRALPRRPLSAAALIRRYENLPSIAYGELRADLDEAIDPWMDWPDDG